MGVLENVEGQIVDSGLTTEQLLCQLIVISKQNQLLLTNLIKEQEETNELLKAILT